MSQNHLWRYSNKSPLYWVFTLEQILLAILVFWLGGWAMKIMFILWVIADIGMRFADISWTVAIRRVIQFSFKHLFNQKRIF